MHLEGMTLDRSLELFIAVVRQTHRLTVGIERSHQAVEREIVMILGAVADRVARMEEQLLEREFALLHHLDGALHHFAWRLGRHHHVQGLAGAVVPAVGVVRFQRRGIHRLRAVVAFHDQPVGRRVIQLILDLGSVKHALLAQLAVFLAVRPYRLVLAHHAREYRRILQAGEDVVVERCRAAYPHEAECAPGIALQRACHRTVLDDFILELQLVFGKTETGEIVIDQDRYGMSQVGWGFTGRQQHVFTVKRRESHAVTHQIGGSDYPVRLQFIAEQAQIKAEEVAVGLGGAQDECMRLLVRPVRHVAGAYVACEDLGAGYLGNTIDTEFDLAVAAIPLDGRQDFFFKQGSKRFATDRRYVNRYAGHYASLQKTTTRKVEFCHLFLLKSQGAPQPLFASGCYRCSSDPSKAPAGHSSGGRHCITLEN